MLLCETAYLKPPFRTVTYAKMYDLAFRDDPMSNPMRPGVVVLTLASRQWWVSVRKGRSPIAGWKYLSNHPDEGPTPHDLR